MFKNRNDAAMQLAQKLKRYKYTDGIILAVPRGGVPLGYIIANELDLPLEVILSKKIGHPRNPEFAIGSVSLQGAFVNENVIDVTQQYILSEIERIQKNLKEKFELYVGNRAPTNLKDKTVIIVDDGIATGSTILATLEVIKRNQPKEIIIAVPVAPESTAIRISKVVDEFVCLYIPKYFSGVAQFYEDFSQVSEDTVIKLLRDAEEIRRQDNHQLQT